MTAGGRGRGTRLVARAAAVAMALGVLGARPAAADPPRPTDYRSEVMPVAGLVLR